MVRVSIEKGVCTYVRALLLVAFVSRLQQLRLHTVPNFCVTNLKISFSSFIFHNAPKEVKKYNLKKKHFVNITHSAARQFFP